MFKIKKRPLKPAKEPQLYNVLENYTDFDPPGNVMVCAMAGEENIEHHAKVLGESYEIPVDDMFRLLTDGGLYAYPEAGGVVTRGMFVCRVDPTGPKQTWVLDLEQTAQAEQLARFSDVPLAEAVPSACFTGGSPRTCGNVSHRRILGSITANWNGRWLEEEISGILISGKTGHPISNASVRCRTGRWSKPVGSGNLPSFMALRWRRRRR